MKRKLSIILTIIAFSLLVSPLALAHQEGEKGPESFQNQEEGLHGQKEGPHGQQCTDNLMVFFKLADELDLSLDEIKEEMDSGKGLPEIAEENDIEMKDILPKPDIKPDIKGPHIPMEELAERLGITVDELKDTMEEGTTIHELAEELGIEVENILPEEKPHLKKGAFLHKLMEELGMNLKELEDELDSGKTIGEILDELDFNVYDFIGELIDEAISTDES